MSTGKTAAITFITGLLASLLLIYGLRAAIPSPAPEIVRWPVNYIVAFAMGTTVFGPLWLLILRRATAGWHLPLLALGIAGFIYGAYTMYIEAGLPVIFSTGLVIYPAAGLTTWAIIRLVQSRHAKP